MEDFVVVYDSWTTEFCIVNKSTPQIIHCVQFLSFNTNSAMLPLKVPPVFPKKRVAAKRLKSDAECFE